MRAKAEGWEARQVWAFFPEFSQQFQEFSNAKISNVSDLAEKGQCNKNYWGDKEGERANKETKLASWE